MPESVTNNAFLKPNSPDIIASLHASANPLSALEWFESGQQLEKVTRTPQVSKQIQANILTILGMR